MTIPKPPKKITSDYAILDVTKERKKLSEYFARGGHPIKVVLTGIITSQWGADDATSIEFEVAITDVELP